MTVSALAQLLAYVGSAIGVAMVLPQIQRIVRHPHLAGVSPWTWAITAVSCSLWLTYGVRAGSLPQIPGNVLLISGAVAVVLLVPARWSRPVRAAGLAAATAVLVLVSTRLEPEAVGFLAFGIGIVGMWPQVYETLWLRRGMGPSALSLSSQALKIASQSCWFAFALLVVDVPVVVSATLALTTAIAVTAVEASRRRAPGVLVAPAVDRELADAV